jgi:predicted ATPase
MWTSVSPCVWGALVTRIDMLSAAEADLLKCAAIIGAEFPVDILEQTMVGRCRLTLSTPR